MRKDTCEMFCSLNIFDLKRWGYLSGNYRTGTLFWTSGMYTNRVNITVSWFDQGSCLSLSYRYQDHDGAWRNPAYQVNIRNTPCFFGGKRYWFVCPLIRDGIPCRRRVGILYSEGKYFGCRCCYRLAYQSQQETHTGWRGYFGKLLFSGLPERADALRVKYWRGRPTKRYRGLLRKIERLPDADPRIVAEKMRVRYSRKPIKTLL